MLSGSSSSLASGLLGAFDFAAAALLLGYSSAGDGGSLVASTSRLSTLAFLRLTDQTVWRSDTV